jgi:hypothetical protein
MTQSKKLRELKDRKRLLVAKADLQRSTFIMTATPLMQIARKISLGVVALRVGKSLARRFSRPSDSC